MGNAQENRFLAPLKGILNTFRNCNTNVNIPTLDFFMHFKSS